MVSYIFFAWNTMKILDAYQILYRQFSGRRGLVRPSGESHDTQAKAVFISSHSQSCLALHF